jgi:FK506-binding protein 1
MSEYVLMLESRFDSSVGRGDLITPIGVGRVIKGTQPHIETCARSANTDSSAAGWDEGILGSSDSAPMSLGEKATLTISAYVMLLLAA